MARLASLCHGVAVIMLRGPLRYQNSTLEDSPHVSAYPTDSTQLHTHYGGCLGAGFGSINELLFIDGTYPQLAS